MDSGVRAGPTPGCHDDDQGGTGNSILWTLSVPRVGFDPTPGPVCVDPFHRPVRVGHWVLGTPRGRVRDRRVLRRTLRLEGPDENTHPESLAIDRPPDYPSRGYTRGHDSNGSKTEVLAGRGEGLRPRKRVVRFEGTRTPIGPPGLRRLLFQGPDAPPSFYPLPGFLSRVRLLSRRCGSTRSRVFRSRYDLPR